jgi:hypothetical protein
VYIFTHIHTCVCNHRGRDREKEKWGRRQSPRRKVNKKINTEPATPYTRTTHIHTHTHPTPGTWTDRGTVKKGDLLLNNLGFMTHTLVGLANDKPTKIGK